MKTTNPIAKRLLDLEFTMRPEDAEELAFLEEYVQWKAANGPQAYEHTRDAERLRQFDNTQRLLRWGLEAPSPFPNNGRRLFLDSKSGGEAQSAR
jgi:hypothetical protein